MPEPLQLKRWKRVEYERLVETGAFTPGDRVELIDGLLVVAEPQSSPHYTAIRLVERVLARAHAVEVLGPSDVASVLGAPSARISVGDLLP
jgi:hypothetical protein